MITCDGVELRVSISELERAYRASLDPLAFLRVIGVCPARNWSIRLTAGADQAPDLTIHAPNDVDVTAVLDGRFPMLHDADAVEVLSSSEITLRNFAGGRFDSAWTDMPAIEQYLLANTWLGSTMMGSGPSLDYQCLGLRRDIGVASNRQPAVVLKNDEALIGVSASSRRKGIEVRDYRYGALPSQVADPLIRNLRDLGFTHGTLVELGTGWPVELGAFGRLIVDPQAVTLAESFEDRLKRSTRVGALAVEMREKELARQAALLNLRIEQAKVADEVWCDDRIIGNVPTSEQGTVALIHKLEALNAIPIATFVSRAWASSEGIDAIADVRLSLKVPIRTDVPVEYEFRFVNFLHHKHPHEHVELVICWDDAEGLLHGEPNSFLRTYVGEGKSIPVLLVRHFPTIKVTHHGKKEKQP